MSMTSVYVELILLAALFAGGLLLQVLLIRFVPLQTHPTAWGVSWVVYGLCWGVLPVFTHARVWAQHSTGLILHVLFAISASGMFAAAVVHALLLSREERLLHAPQGARQPVALPVLLLEKLLFRFVWIGFALLSASLVAGAMAGGMTFLLKIQHKTAFALLAWLIFAALLVGRWHWGWRGLKAARMVYWGSVFLLLAYVGTRVVLELVLKRGMVA